MIQSTDELSLNGREAFAWLFGEECGKLYAHEAREVIAKRWGEDANREIKELIQSLNEPLQSLGKPNP